MTSDVPEFFHPPVVHDGDLVKTSFLTWDGTGNAVRVSYAYRKTGDQLADAELHKYLIAAAWQATWLAAQGRPAHDE